MVLERLGVLTDEVSSDFLEALNWIETAGFKHVEIRLVDGVNVMTLSDDRIDWIREEVERRSLYVSVLASPVFKCALDPARAVASGDTFGQQEEDVRAHMVKLERAIQIASRLQARSIRIFAFWRERDPAEHTAEIVGHLRTAAAIAAKSGITLLLENEPSCNGGFAEEVAMLIREVNSSALQALWDPGNEEYGGRQSYPAGYEQVKHTIGHIHLKDAYMDRYGNSRSVPIGMGSVPFSEQFSALQRDGYKGLFSLETHYIPEGGTAMDGTRLTLETLRLLIKGDSNNDG